MLALVSDVTEQETLRGRVLHDERLATIGEMAAHVAHEVRNPLGGAWGALQFGFLLPIPGTVERALLRIAALLQALQSVALVMLLLDTTRQRAEFVRGFNQTLLDAMDTGLACRARVPCGEPRAAGALSGVPVAQRTAGGPRDLASTGETDGSS